MGELKQQKDRKQRWRENIEALTVAVVVALLFKLFILEISKIPSGSMQPTLMGSPEAQVFDRVLVDKLSYRFRDPKRFEIVVFKHPLERSRIMVKRLVGLPGEELKIEHGDLWTRSGPDQDWHILARPEAVQEAMWKTLDLASPERSSWSVLMGGRDWSLRGRDIVARGAGRARFRPDRGPIRDGYTDGYPDSLRGSIRYSDIHGRNPVGDLRVSGELRPEAGVETFLVELTEGLRAYEFRLPGPAAADGAAPEIRVRDSSQGAPSALTESGDPWRLEAGDNVDFVVQNLDDVLTLMVDSEVLVTATVQPNAKQEAAVTLGLEAPDGTRADIEALQVERDLYYLPPPGQRSWEVSIPEGHYVMLGDNTQDSADSRDWRAVTFEWPENGAQLKQRGNYRDALQGANPVYGHATDGVAFTRFRDEWGDAHWFPSEKGKQATFPGPAPLVPRSLIQGRALAVFWPIKPWKKLWRLGWLR